MRRKPRMSAILLAILLIAVPGAAFAEEGPAPRPNQYEKKKLDLDTEYIHEGSLLKEKERLSEEQKLLTFKREEKKLFEAVKGRLFMSDAKVTTASSKAEKLNLFTGENASQPKKIKREEPAGEGTAAFLPVILGVLLAICVLFLFFILVPRINKA
ncbi:type VII secretion protein EssA [Peribacillus sp. SCS-37]|uniref:type VII secretion protein EssA n=1 Tax=Paraperibacillus esterisolvens TaxID=3115296 RepID=UPI003905D0F0